MRKIFYSFWIVLFFVGIIVPLFHMNPSEITEQENRTLARFPETRKKDKPNYEFGKEFESWLSDRFWGRDQLIDARFQTMYKINGRIENDKAFVGDDGWMFMKYNTLMISSLETQRERTESTIKILKNFFSYFPKTKIYLIVYPNRSEIYQKYWDKSKMKKFIDFETTVSQQFKSDKNIQVILLKNEFIKNKNINLFEKNDHHFSCAGEIISGKAMLKELGFMENSLSYTCYNIYNQNYIANVLGLKSSKKSIAKYVKIKSSQINYDNTKLLMMGPCCYNIKLFKLIRGYFKESKFIRTNLSTEKKRKTAKLDIEKIMRNQPDVLVFVVAYNRLSELNLLDF